MKILIDGRLYGFENTGIGRYIVNLVDELSKVDPKNKYVLLLKNKYVNTVKVPENWSIVECNYKHYGFEEQIKLPRLINKINPDLVHFPHFNVPIRYKGKFVVTIHDLSMHKRTGKSATTLPFFVYKVKRLGYGYVFKSAVYNSQKIIVPTKYVKGELLKHYPVDLNKIFVTYEGLDHSVTSDKKLDKKALPYFLYVGNIYPHKNIKRVIEAIKFLNEEHKLKVKFVIVSARSVFLNRVEEYIKSLSAGNYVNVVGYVSDEKLANLYKNSVGFVYASLEEGFGLPGLEAMANETLLLASDIPVFHEIFIDNAIYFNPYDFSSIENAMFDAYNLKKSNRIEKVGKAKEFVKKYSWKKTAEETLKVYNSVK